MSVLAQARGAEALPWLTPGLRALSDDALLRHFARRETPVLFVVEEPTETTAEKLAGVMQGAFEFNHERYQLGQRFNWFENPSPDVEWHILLHKFYYAVGLARVWRDTGDDACARRAAELISSWIEADVPAGFIAADVTGRRLQNWIYAWSMLVHWPGFSPALNRAFLRAVHAQTSWLAGNLHQKRNHRTLELYAIFLAAVAFPEMCEASHWRAFALRELTANASADFRADGGHCEQSTHYHCIVLRNFLHVVRLARLNHIALDQNLLDTLKAALHFAAAIHRPDGEIPAFSDADGGSYLDVIKLGAELLGAPAPAPTSAHFPDTGYVVLRRARNYLILDAGPLGEGNHGHIDALSIEVCANGQPLIVDPGRYTYDEGGEINWRAAFRATAAHSTIQVDGLNQARYEPGKRRWKITGAPPAARVRAFHAGGAVEYAHAEVVSAEYPALHQRHVFFVDGAYWLIFDLLSSPSAHRYDLRYQLAPAFADARLLTNGNGCALETSAAHIAVAASAPGQAMLEQGWVSRLYGSKAPAPRLRFTTHAGNAAFATLIAPRGVTTSIARADVEAACSRVRAAIQRGDAMDEFEIDFDSARTVRRLSGGRSVTLLGAT